MDIEKVKTELDKLAERRGIALTGVADLEFVLKKFPDTPEFPEAEGFTRAVVFGMRLQKAALRGIEDGPTLMYFHHYRQLNYHLDTVALEAAALLQRYGADALAIPASQIIERKPKMIGHMSHKKLAWAAGLGWAGRSSLLVNPEFGSQVRYISVLTDMQFNPGKPIEDNCGKCRRCVKKCPAGAIHNSVEDFDLEACTEKLTEFSKRPFIGQHICGVCVKACSGKE